jgi:predicted regulator of Ras-like GTPase activity (Roadblock/LC7/MglB family)
VSKQEQIQVVLAGLNASVPEIKGSLLASLDGMPIAYALKVGTVDPARIAAMTATALGIGKRTSESLGAGTLQEVHLAGSEGRIFVYTVAGRAALTVVAPMDTNVGLIGLEARDMVNKLLAII